LINKLKKAGIASILDLAVSIPYELAQDIESGNNNPITVASAFDIDTVSNLVMKAKKSLIKSGVLSKEFCTADEVLERRKDLLRYTTGAAKFDSFLKGGIETQAITEIAGEFGSGKSQICHTLCVTGNIIKKEKNENGAFEGNSVIFIDTENTFRAERVHQIAEARGFEPEEILKKVYVCKIYSSVHLEQIIKNLGKYLEQYKVKLVIIDSIIALHRVDFPGRESLAERQQRLNVMLHKLIRLAEIYNVAIVLLLSEGRLEQYFISLGDSSC
jgi:DNA repair protein RadA